MIQDNPIIVIVGPTASGKSVLAVEIARKIGGEIISADSRQVYKGMDIGSGKITKREMRGVPHHLLDVASPKRIFTVAQYVKLGQRAIEGIERRGRIPVVCGGTGLYIRALVDNLKIPDVPPNRKLRAEFSKKSALELFTLLKKKDPERAASIDSKNPRRLIRALEIVETAGKVPKLKTNPRPNVIFIGIKKPIDELKKLIEARLKKRIEAGMLAEIKKLHCPPAGGGVSWQRMHDLGLEYRFGALFLQDKLSKEEFDDQLLRASIKYAKRQMTWFKKDKRIHWIKNSSEAVALARQHAKNPAIYSRV